MFNEKYLKFSNQKTQRRSDLKYVNVAENSQDLTKISKKLIYAKYWFSDRTFDTVLSFFAQMYKIHAWSDNYAFSAVYALLANKKQSTYTSMLEKLLDIDP